MTENKKKYPPSLRKYKENNPTISFVLTKNLKESLDGFRGKMSYGQAIKKLIIENDSLLNGRTFEKGYEVGYKKGYEDAKGKYEIALPCPLCGKHVTFDPTDDMFMMTVKKKISSEISAHKGCLRASIEQPIGKCWQSSGYII